MDSILSTLRKINYEKSENVSNIASYFLLFLLFGFGYYLFFYNPDSILEYIRTPLTVLYILIVAYVLFFIFKRLKENNPLFNIGFELTSHTVTYGKMLLLIFSVFLSFYLFYKLMISILLKTLDISIFLTMIILIIVLAIINNYVKISDSDMSNDIIDFIKDLIFYIPCLLTDAIEYIKKDYSNTPSTVIILFIILVLICLLYVGSSYVNYNNPLLLIDKPCYLNTSQVSLNRKQLQELIIQSRPWYERELLRLQHTVDSSGNTSFDVSFNVNMDQLTVAFTEGFTSILAQETIPVHLSISEYDKYILAQAMYKDPTIAENVPDASGNMKEYIAYIVKQQERLMTLYERILLSFTIYGSSNLSQTLLGNMNGNKYHYGISFWLYLFSDQTMVGKDTILQYGLRPSMYFDNSAKELTVEITQNNAPVVLYSTTNILYQRWNHIVMNYNYGTFDLFINNNLVSTNGDIINYVSPDELLQVGFNDNNNLGGIAQMLYSEQPFQLNEIGNLYLRQPKI